MTIHVKKNKSPQATPRGSTIFATVSFTSNILVFVPMVKYFRKFSISFNKQGLKLKLITSAS